MFYHFIHLPVVNDFQFFRPCRILVEWDFCFFFVFGASKVVLVVKNPPAKSGALRDVGLIPGWEDPLEEEMTTHSGILAWKIAWTEDLEGCSSRDRKRAGHDLATKQQYIFLDN